MWCFLQQIFLIDRVSITLDKILRNSRPQSYLDDELEISGLNIHWHLVFRKPSGHAAIIIISARVQNTKMCQQPTNHTHLEHISDFLKKKSNFKPCLNAIGLNCMSSYERLFAIPCIIHGAECLYTFPSQKPPQVNVTSVHHNPTKGCTSKLIESMEVLMFHFGI
jgi:hypothetical protein